MDDNKIVELYFARNEDAIRHTQDAYGRRLFALAENIVRNDQDAQECENDTYFTAWDTIPPQYPTYFFGYLAKICRNFALGRLDWNTAAKRNAPVVSLIQEMEYCIPDSSRERELITLPIQAKGCTGWYEDGTDAVDTLTLTSYKLRGPGNPGPLILFRRNCTSGCCTKC